MAAFYLLSFGALATCVLGQGSDFTWIVGAAAGPTLCNKTFADANSTGIFSYTPGVPQVNANYAYAKDIQIAVTVEEQKGKNVQWSLWANTNGANYSDDVALGYDMCAFNVETPTLNTFLRGQSDSGDCGAMLDEDCNSALTSMASSLLLGLVQNATPQPNSNLTAGSAPRLCYEVGKAMTDNFPKECNVFFNGSAFVTGSALTAPSKSATTDTFGSCDLTETDSSNKTFHHVGTINGAPTRVNYITFNYLTTAFIFSWFPVADISATTSITNANSVMACPRADHVNAGSESVPAAPTPTPLNSGSKLSGGAIAGIVVGVVLGVGLIVGAACWFWRRSRKAKKPKASGDVPAYTADAKEQPAPMAEAPPDTVVNELSPDNELRPELSGDARKLNNKPVNEQPAELLAEVPESKGTYR